MGGRGHLWVCLVIRVHCVCDFRLERVRRFTGQGLTYVKHDRSVAIAARLGGRALFIAGDKPLA
jgi:hypothetical protein